MSAAYGSVLPSAVVGEASAAAPERRARRGRGCWLASFAVASGALAVAALDARAKLARDGGLHPWHPLTLAGQAESYVEVVVPMTTFLASEPVRNFLHEQGISPDASDSVLEKVLPRKLILQARSPFRAPCFFVFFRLSGERDGRSAGGARL